MTHTPRIDQSEIWRERAADRRTSMSCQISPLSVHGDLEECDPRKCRCYGFWEYTCFLGISYPGYNTAVFSRLPITHDRKQFEFLVVGVNDRLCTLAASVDCRQREQKNIANNEK